MTFIYIQKKNTYKLMNFKTTEIKYTYKNVNIIKALQIISGVLKETASFVNRKLFQFLESLQGCFKLFSKKIKVLIRYRR